jgi:hypothetical protein
MTTSQSDVDKVMAAFGAAPMTYRPNQDAAAGWNVPAAATPASAPARTDNGAAHTTPSAQAAERILPGAGGRVREIFPLLWRAIPGVGDLKIGAIKRPGDEVSEPREPDSAADNRLPARLPEAVAQPASHEAHPPPHQAAPDGPETAAGPAAHQRWVRPVPTAPRGDAAAMEQSPAQWDRQAPMPKQGAPPPPPPPAPVAALAAKPLPPLRSHADLIRPVGQRAPTPAPGPTVEPAVAAPATPAPAVASQPAAPAPNVVQPPAAADAIASQSGGSLSAAPGSAAGLPALLSASGDAATGHAALSHPSRRGGMVSAGLSTALSSPLSAACRHISAELPARLSGQLPLRLPAAGAASRLRPGLSASTRLSVWTGLSARIWSATTASHAPAATGNATGAGHGDTAGGGSHRAVASCQPVGHFRSPPSRARHRPR